MPSTIGWLAVAITAGSLLGLTIGHWSIVAAWLHRCLEDPVGQPHDAAQRAHPSDPVTPLHKRLGRMS